MTTDTIFYLGLTASLFVTVAYLPQNIKIIKTKNTKSLSLWMCILLNIGIVLWLFYGIFKHDTVIIIANAVAIIMNTLMLFLKIKYK